jgi:hypothetical protein
MPVTVNSRGQNQRSTSATRRKGEGGSVVQRLRMRPRGCGVGRGEPGLRGNRVGLIANDCDLGSLDALAAEFRANAALHAPRLSELLDAA